MIGLHSFSFQDLPHHCVYSNMEDQIISEAYGGIKYHAHQIISEHTSNKT